MIETSGQLSPREVQEHDWRINEFEKQAEHAITMKKLELEVDKLEAKWSSWMKIPITIVKLPVYCLMAFGYIIAVARKHEPSDNFWRFLK